MRTAVETHSLVPANDADWELSNADKLTNALTSDGHLIKAIAKGDQCALERLYARHSVRVYRFVLRITGNSTLAEDVVSDIFLTVWRDAESFKAAANASTWLLAIARDRALRVKVHCAQALTEDRNPPDRKDPDDGSDGDTNDRRVLLRRCLKLLADDQRELFDLVYYHKKSISEVAEIVGATADAVKAKMLDARARLKKVLAIAECGQFATDNQAHGTRRNAHDKGQGNTGAVRF